MGRINAYPNTTKPASDDEILIDGPSGTRNMLLSDLATTLPGMISADMRRNIYRGKNLGGSFTDTQKAAIRNATFDDLYVGDYWVVNGIVYRIMDIDYWRFTGDTACTDHHLVIMPQQRLFTHVMNDTNVTTGGYVNSKMYKEGLNQAKATINAAFGSESILNHRELLVNGVSNGVSSGVAWLDSTVELPNEIMVYGSYIFTPANDGQTVPNLYTINKTQLAGFRLFPGLISISRQDYWLRDVVSAAHFAIVDDGGGAYYGGASLAAGVRPVFGIHG